MKKMKIRGVAFMGVVAVAVAVIMPYNAHPMQAKQHAEEPSTNTYQSYGDQNELYMYMDMDGNITYAESQNPKNESDIEVPELVNEDTTFDVMIQVGDYEPVLEDRYTTLSDAQQASDLHARSRSIGDADVYTNKMLRSTSTPSVLYIKNTGSNLSYTDVNTGASGYLNSLYAGECAYIRTEDNGDIIFKLAGVTGRIAHKDAGAVEIIKWSSSLNTSAYYVKQGNLYHFVSTYLYSNNGAGSYQLMGKAPAYLAEGGEYYSYDGHYFYEDFAGMSYDYQNNTIANAMNSSAPFYNYYQYLSHRSKSSFTADDFNHYINFKVSGRSALKSTGQNFISTQNTYGVNATMMFGVACNESGYGTSNYALNRNNLFGLNAVDSNPDLANSFSSVAACIDEYGKYWISDGYINPADWRYFGSHLGDKQSGMGVKYASDPYWAEKAAAQGYHIENYTGTYDSRSYKTGIYAGSSYLAVYKHADSSASPLYYTTDDRGKSVRGVPFIILDTINADGTTWYKIQSDAALSDDRSVINSTGIYDFTNCYAYVKADNILIVNEGGNTPTPDPDPDPDASYNKGDVNGDGRISSMDYVLVKNHIMGIASLSGASASAADVNGDGRISSMDYVLIKNHILGISQIS